MHEFNLIDKYFRWDNVPSDVAVSVGDDAAILNIPVNQQLVTSIDTLISGVHFPENTSPHAIGYKALAVNLSDIAAMGATPKWFTLALTLPDINETWLEDFSRGLTLIASQHQCFLIGGDTTRGPLSISIQVMGLVDRGKAFLRSGAKVGDAIYVTGHLGDAAYGLNHPDNRACKKRLDYPTPKLAQSQFIKRFTTACLDVSDGLLQDLSHIITASSVGATLDLSAIPLSKELKDIPHEKALDYALTGGDDYELLFTIPANQKTKFEEKVQKLGGMYFNSAQHNYHYIGEINAQKGTITDENGNKITGKGYNHFHGK